MCRFWCAPFPVKFINKSVWLLHSYKKCCSLPLFSQVTDTKHTGKVEFHISISWFRRLFEIYWLLFFYLLNVNKQQAWEKDVKVNTIIKTCTIIPLGRVLDLFQQTMKEINLHKHIAPAEEIFFCFFIRLVYQKLIKIFSVGAGRDVVELNNLLHRNMMSRNLTRRIMWNIKIKTNQLFFHQWQELSGVIKCISIHSRTTTSQYTVQYQRVLACHLMLPWRTIDDDDDEKRVVEEDDDDEDSVKRILIIH